MFKRKVEMSGKTFTARLGLLHWKDAMIVTKSGGEFIDLPDCISIGFIFTYKGVTYIIHNFSDGVVDDYLALPKSWCVSTYYFRR